MTKPNLFRQFPDGADLLALQPEDLAPFVLASSRTAIQNGAFCVEHMLTPLYPPHGNYPTTFKFNVMLAVSEAVQHLVNNGLVIPHPNSPGYYLHSRLAASLQSNEDYETFQKGRLLPSAILSTHLREKTWPLFLRGDHDTAVFQAYKEIEVAVREASRIQGINYPDDLVGHRLMVKAFDPETGPLRDITVVDAERQAERNLFLGAIGHAKNPVSHRHVGITPEDAAKLIVFADYLMGIVIQRGIQDRSSNAAG